MVHWHFGPSHDLNKDVNLSISVHVFISLGNKFERLGWLPIDLHIKYFEGIQVYNILDGSCPEYLKGFIKLF